MMPTEQPQLPLLKDITFSITVKEGRNLVAKDRNVFGKKTTSDPFVKVSLLNRVYGQTNVQNKTTSPKWNEQFQIIIAGEQQTKQVMQSSIQLSVWDKDTVTNDDPMGVVMISCKDLILNSEADSSSLQWYPVQQGTPDKNFYCKNASGEIQVYIKVIASRVADLVPGNVLPIQSGYTNIHVGLSWDFMNGHAIDIDTSCVAVDRRGEIIIKDTVYFGNLTNTNKSVYHAGDERTGETAGDDEVIHCHLDKVPDNIIALYFVLSVVTEGKALDDIQSARARIVDTETGNVICQYTPNNRLGFGGNHKYTSIILARLHRSSTNRNWMFSPIEEGHPMARDFGLLIPQIKSYTRDIVHNIRIDPNERVAVMRKDGIIRVSDFCRPSDPIASNQDKNNTNNNNNGTLPEWLSFGLAWDVTNGKFIDLDASALCLDSNLNLFDTIYFRNLRSKDGSIIHSGDEREGDSVGDDETINFSLNFVDPDVKYIGVVINSFSGQELDDVSSASCHLYNTQTKQDIAIYALTNSKILDKHTALVVGCLFRATNNNGDWYLRIISEPAQGRTVNDNVDELQNYLRKNPLEDSINVIVEDENCENEIDLSNCVMPAYMPHNDVVSTDELKKCAIEEDIVLPSSSASQQNPSTR